MSGDLPITPSPEHGASQSMASNAIAGSNGRGSVESAAKVSIIDMPNLPAASVTAFNLPGYFSRAYKRPSFFMSAAICVALPPGALQASSTVSPGAGARSKGTSWEASS